MPKVIQVVYGRAKKLSHESKKSCIQMFITALFIIVTWVVEVTTRNIENEKIMWYIHTTEE